MLIKRLDGSTIGEWESVATAVAGGADLRGANLRGAYLQRANLHGANLRGADLQRANLQGADLQGADLQGADLRGADLQRADLRGANLQWAYLQRADLQGADLQGANLRGANLRGANLQGADLPATEITPPEGAFIGWKKCKAEPGGEKEVIVKLEIPADAARSNATGRKCRASHVRVLDVIGADVGYSLRDAVTAYRAGEMVKAHKWEPDKWIECAGGIHFFLTRGEAEEFTL